MQIFGVKIDSESKKNVLKKCLQNLQKSAKKPLFIVTLNPEILLTAKKDLKYKKIINSANLRITDGFGIKFISWLKKEKIGARITGADLAQFLLEKASDLKLKTGIIYLKEGWSTQKEIEKSLTAIKDFKLIGVKLENLENFDSSQVKNCQLILVAIGHPHQEIIIHNNLSNFKKARIIMGIGGTLDFWTKKKLRAPKIIRRLGLEWLWRLTLQPNRFFRIFNAVIKFPILALLSKQNEHPKN